jgi:hypothetical protein
VTAEVNVPNEAVPTADDTRRALEALGFQRGTDRIDLTRIALDAYSVVFEPSRKWQMDHEHALLAAIVAAAGLIVAAAMEKLAAQYPDTEFPETADEITRCAAAGISPDGIQALAIRERLLTEAKHLRDGQ